MDAIYLKREFIPNGSENGYACFLPGKRKAYLFGVRIPYKFARLLIDLFVR